MNGAAIESLGSLYIQSLGIDGKPLASGTGFVVAGHDSHYLITNWHNVTGKNIDTGAKLDAVEGWTPTALAIHHRSTNSPFLETVCVVEPLYNEDTTPRWLQHSQFERVRVDVVALPLTKTRGVEIFAHTLGRNSFTLKVGDHVNIVGYPLDLRDTDGGLPLWIPGAIASEPTGGYENKSIILVNADTRKGQSGSPVLNIKDDMRETVSDNRGNVFMGTGRRFCDLVGVYSGRLKTKKEDTNIGRVWKARLIAEIIEQR